MMRDKRTDAPSMYVINVHLQPASPYMVVKGNEFNE